ncbi:platelet-activating factor acetylhydrolase, isoform II-domain-containing protein [Thelonectria olida]|uniref:Putative phospholipase n=1 Tax=Thelonectria olida TaxID=1576542 RepID=A0A9P8VZE0_9HYPO|nr:platelet-activating factor acetylhydrolase, isoform II-domain-containing protein [Thelonectria olida]
MATKLASCLSRLSPVPAFPEYTGPYKVGTIDIDDIHTVQFRMFYPAAPASGEKRIGWLPTPQRQHLSAYTKFLGIGPMLAEFLSFLPRHLHYTTIPVHKNATLHEDTTENHRWPTMIFSHGLGGGRNSYSYIAGSLASDGIVVLAPEHRDGSAVATFVRNPEDSAARQEIPYTKISHDVSPADPALGIGTDSRGTPFTNMNRSTPAASVNQFVGKLNIHEPGSIIFAGHSLSGATINQFLKSTYYADVPEVAAMEKPLFAPATGSEIREQVTEKTVTMLLDMRCMPLMAPNSEPLFNLPLPTYADLPTAPGGRAILAVESESFFKWTEHLNVKARLLSPNPSVKVVTPELYERPSGIKLLEPNFFYVINSAHLNQSDFGILFLWLTKKIFSAEQPERALRLNLRAQLQILRVNGVPVARTHLQDLVDGTQFDKLDIAKDTNEKREDGIDDDQAIFDKSDSHFVDHWRWVDIIGLGDAGEKETGKTIEEQVEEGEQEMGGALEPSEEMPGTPQVQPASAVAA